MAKDVISGDCRVGTFDFTSVASASAYRGQDVWLGADIIYSVDAGVGLGHTVVDYLRQGKGRHFFGVFRETRHGVAEFISILTDAAGDGEEGRDRGPGVPAPISTAVAAAGLGHALLAGLDLNGGVYHGCGYVLVAAHSRA